jgi:CO dehydrogenase/acetyl-CoA synthase delta subunit
MNTQTISSKLTFKDKLGSVLARWTINRMNHILKPGLYALGNPNRDSIVLVSANYKLSFDFLRKELGGINAWILVIDTKGINVWCAAGKGTFGTQEIVRMINESGLSEKVDHQEIILPQLGASGVAAHEVKKLTGFKVIYGPVRSADIPAFLNAGKKATLEMRTVRFPFIDRVKLIPAEIVFGFRTVFPFLIFFVICSGIRLWGISLAGIKETGVLSVVNVLSAYLMAAALGPALLPYLPGRSFSAKGYAVGILTYIGLLSAGTTGNTIFDMISWFFIVPAIASFIVMNFTGSSTYTSFSGVIKEMKVAIPFQIISIVFGVGFWVVARFV